MLQINIFKGNFKKSLKVNYFHRYLNFVFFELKKTTMVLNVYF